MVFTLSNLLFQFVLCLLLHGLELEDLSVEFASLLHESFLHLPLALLHFILTHFVEGLLLHSVSNSI